jgi:light-regulated signal transduction histidine kinase (bacteriophytochrome)
MNRLLKRQIRKFFPEEYLEESKFNNFLEAISRSYDTTEEQHNMTQRAMKISSIVLRELNFQLVRETKAQQEVFKSLRQTLNTLGLLKSSANQIDSGELEVNPEMLTITIRKQAEELVEVNKNQELLLKDLANQNQELNDYARVVSHDLKSPLRTIDTLVNWLREDHAKSLTDEAHGLLTKIEDQLEKMDTLISGILKYASIDKVLNKEKPIKLNLLVQNVVSLINVPPEVTFTVGVLPIIVADSFKLAQLFENLIVNAIASIDKEKGYIKITCRGILDFWEFAISDNGKGIKKDYFKKIFEVFQKLENEDHSGGIGLPIVKKVVSHYGGTVWLESEENKGTTFYFTIRK